jgi:hypothetical protein
MALPKRGQFFQKRRRAQRVLCQQFTNEKKDTHYAFQTCYTQEDGV